MADRFVLPRAEVQDSSGGVEAGAKLQFFESGTSTNLNTYSDDALTTANANPVIADSAGRFGDIFLEDKPYKVTLSNSDDVQTWSADPVRGGVDNLADDTIRSTLATTGSANVYALTVNRVITAYANGDMFVAKANFTITGAATLNVTGGQSGASALGAKKIKKHHDMDLVNRDIENGQWCVWRYDGTNMQLLSPVANAPAEFTNVKVYGAIGDGVADDTSAVNSALVAGGVIYFPPGTYKLTTWSQFSTTADITLISDTAIIDLVSNTVDFIKVLNSVKIIGLTFKNGGSVLENVNTDTGTVTNVIAEDCEFDNSRQTIDLELAFDTFRASGCRFVDCEGDGIRLGRNVFADQDFWKRAIIESNSFRDQVAVAGTDTRCVLLYG